MVSIAGLIFADLFFVNNSSTKGSSSLIVMPDIESNSMMNASVAERLEEGVANARAQRRATGGCSLQCGPCSALLDAVPPRYGYGFCCSRAFTCSRIICSSSGVWV